jgi:hypothetical protein
MGIRWLKNSDDDHPDSKNYKSLDEEKLEKKLFVDGEKPISKG